MYRVIACIALILTAATPVAAQVASEPLPETARPAPAATVEASAGPADDLYARAVEALGAGKLAQARDLLLALTKAEPTHKHAWNELGRAYLALRNPEEARVALEKQVEIEPLHPFAYGNLGNAYLGLGRPVEAEAAHRKQLEITPLAAWAHRSLGTLLLEQKRPHEAVSSLERAVALGHDDSMTRLHLGRAYLQVDQRPRALEIFEGFAAMEPPNPPLINAAAFSLAEAGYELSRARGWVEQTLALLHGALRGATLQQIHDINLRPMSGAMHLWGTLGWVAFKQDDMAAARLWLEAAHAWSDNIDIALRVGVMREKDGRPVEALAAYRRVMTAPSIPYSVDATFRRTAEDAIARLEPEGRRSPDELDAADFALRQSTLAVVGLAAAVRGDVLVSVGTDATIDDVLILGPVDALAPVANALKGTAVPGADVARVRQLRLFRKATVDCTAGGACTLEWQRIP